MSRSSRSRVPVVRSLMLLAAAQLFAVQPASAQEEISIDFQAPSFGSSSGLSMPLPVQDSLCAANALNGTVQSSCGVDLSGNASAEVSLGFSVNIGGTAYQSLFINENGLVTFGAAAPSAAPSATNLADLQSQLSNPFIAPSYANLAPGASAPDQTTPFVIAGGGNGIMYQRGLGVLGAGPYPDGDPRAAPAFNVIWASPVGAADRFISQLIMYSTSSAGDFAFRFRYGLSGDLNPLIGAFGAYSLGSLSGSVAEPFNPATAYLFRVGNPTAVPEPATWLLMLSGLIALGFTRVGHSRVRRALA